MPIKNGGKWYNLRAILDGQAENEKLRCSHPGCPNLRNKIASHCVGHMIQYSIYGVPDGKPVSLLQLRPLIDEILELMAINPDHGGKAAVADFFSARAKAHEAGKQFQFSGEYWLIWNTLDLDTIISRVAALYLLREREAAGHFKEHLPTERSMETGIYQTLCRKLPWAKNGLKRSGKFQYKYFGQQVMQSGLGVFFLALARAVDRRAIQQRQRVETLAAPWKLDGEPPEPEPQKPQKPPCPCVASKKRKPKPKKRKPKPGDPKFRWPLHPVTGKKTTLSALCREYDVPLDRTKWRIDYGGWKLMDALTLPKGANKPNTKKENK